METQLSVTEVAGEMHCFVQLFESAVFVACPGIDRCEVFSQQRPLDRIFAHRHQLDSTPALADGVLLVPERGIDNTDCTQGLRIIGLIAHHFFEFRSGLGEGVACCLLVAAQASNHTLAPGIRKWDTCVMTQVGSDCSQYTWRIVMMNNV